MERVELPLCHCYRCGNVWTPRRTVIRICPRCKSKFWDEPRLRVPPGGGGLGIREIVGDQRSRILRAAERHGLREVRVFGSVARGAAGPKSDLDLLVDMDPRRRPLRGIGTLDFGQEVERMIGRRVDVVTESSLPWWIQPQVIVEAVPL